MGEKWSDLVQNSLAGDMADFRALLHFTFEDQTVAATMGGLVVTKQALLRVLVEFRRHAVAADLVQQWASFVRRGYYGYGASSLRPLNIDYETSAEEQMVEVLGRLDELGDVIDGSVDDAELDAMIQRLQENNPTVREPWS